jgi:hypothetical protein
MTELTQGDAERVLVDRSAEADLLVLGSSMLPASAGAVHAGYSAWRIRRPVMRVGVIRMK